MEENTEEQEVRKYADWYAWNWLEGREYHAKNGWEHKQHEGFHSWQKGPFISIDRNEDPGNYWEWNAECGEESFSYIEELDSHIEKLQDLRKAWHLAMVKERMDQCTQTKTT